MSIDLKFVELTADVLDFFLIKDTDAPVQAVELKTYDSPKVQQNGRQSTLTSHFTSIPTHFPGSWS